MAHGFQQVVRQAEQEKLEALEMKLLVPDILLFRHLAARTLRKQRKVQGLHSPSTPVVSSSQAIDAANAAASNCDKPAEAPQEASVKESSAADTPQPERRSMDAESPSGSTTR